MTSSTWGLRLFTRPAFQLALVATVSAVLLVFRVVQLSTLARDRLWAADFRYYWTAATQVLHGEPIYSAQQLAGRYIAEDQVGFLYPPPFAALLTPFVAILPADGQLAAWLWMVLGVALATMSTIAVVRSERLFNRLTPAIRPHSRLLFVVAALAFPPVIAELSVGNVHLEILALLSLGWLGIRRGDRQGDVVGGAAIGVAAVLKVFPGLLLGWLLVTRRWRAAGASLAAAVVLAVVTLPFTGLQPWFDYPAVLTNMGPILDIHDSVSATMWLAPALGFSVARWLVTALGLGLLVLAARLRPLSISFALAVAVSVLISPTVFHHYLAVLVLPLLLALAGGVSWRWVAAAYFLMWGGQQAALGEYSWVLSRVPQTVGWGLLLVALVRQGLGARGPVPDAALPAIAAPT